MTFRRPFTRDDTGWREDAACRNTDVDLFFPVGTTGEVVEETGAAIALCRRCPVREQCLEFAMVTNQRDGIWGGTSEEDRRRMRSAWVAARRRRELAS
jgi:WhiB family transcriptional regulator, redox-sensing transcriptional regulator